MVKRKEENRNFIYQKTFYYFFTLIMPKFISTNFRMGKNDNL